MVKKSSRSRSARAADDLRSKLEESRPPFSAATLAAIVKALLRDPDGGVRDAAGSLLKRYGSKAIIRSLLPHLNHRSIRARNDVMEILAAIGPLDPAALAAPLAAHAADTRIFAATVIRAFAPERIDPSAAAILVDLLLKTLTAETDGRVIATALEALGAVATRLDEDGIHRVAAGIEARLERFAAEYPFETTAALAALGTPTAEQRLLERLAAGPPALQAAAAAALGVRGSPAAARKLLKGLVPSDPLAGVRLAAIVAIGRRTGDHAIYARVSCPAVAAMVKSLDAADGAVRGRAAEALGAVLERRAAPAALMDAILVGLLERLADPDEGARLASAAALRGLGRRHAAALQKAALLHLESDDEFRAAEMMRSLALVGTAVVREILTAFAAPPFPDAIRVAAAEVL